MIMPCALGVPRPLKQSRLPRDGSCLPCVLSRSRPSLANAQRPVASAMAEGHVLLCRVVVRAIGAQPQPLGATRPFGDLRSASIAAEAHHAPPWLGGGRECSASETLGVSFLGPTGHRMRLWERAGLCSMLMFGGDVLVRFVWPDPRRVPTARIRRWSYCYGVRQCWSLGRLVRIRFRLAKGKGGNMCVALFPMRVASYSHRVSVPVPGYRMSAWHVLQSTKASQNWHGAATVVEYLISASTSRQRRQNNALTVCVSDHVLVPL